MKLPYYTTSAQGGPSPQQIASWARALLRLHERLAPYFARREPRQHALLYLQAVVSEIPRKNSWQIAEQARQLRPYGIQRLLSRAVWCHDLPRRLAAHIPETLTFQTKPELAKLMVERAQAAGLPIDWVVADTVYGHCPDLRMWLEEQGYAYALAVPCTEVVCVQTQAGC